MNISKVSEQIVTTHTQAKKRLPQEKLLLVVGRMLLAVSFIELFCGITILIQNGEVTNSSLLSFLVGCVIFVFAVAPILIIFLIGAIYVLVKGALMSVQTENQKRTFILAVGAFCAILTATALLLFISPLMNEIAGFTAGFSSIIVTVSLSHMVYFRAWGRKQV